MIQFQIENTELGVTEVVEPPAIYLDHWALREISANLSWSARMINALKSRGGTLMLSSLNIAEFTKVTDSAQVCFAEALVEKALPNIFFLEIDVFKVVKREDELLAGGPPTAPHADLVLLKEVAQWQTTVNPFTIRNLFAVSKYVKAGQFDRMADEFAEQCNKLRDDDKPKFEKRAKRLPSGPDIERGTRYILPELLCVFLLDQNSKLTRNHAIDLLHSVVPIAYCDLVLLDKHWETQVQKIRSRFAEAKMNVPLAQIYSKSKNGGIERFLSDLEASNF